MGVGDSLEAAMVLRGPIAAGVWHLVGDGIVFDSADLRYDVLWRSAAGDTTLVSFAHHFDPLPPPDQFDAVPFEASAPGKVAPARAGDQLVLRFTAESGSANVAFIPNGDGAHAHGRIPSLQLA